MTAASGLRHLIPYRIAFFEPELTLPPEGAALAPIADLLLYLKTYLDCGYLDRATSELRDLFDAETFDVPGDRREIRIAVLPDDGGDPPGSHPKLIADCHADPPIAAFQTPHHVAWPIRVAIPSPAAMPRRSAGNEAKAL
jgi:hypothetical protein